MKKEKPFWGTNVIVPDGIFNIKNKDGFTIDYCRVRMIKERDHGILLGIFYAMSFISDVEEVPGMYVYLHKDDGHLIALEPFILSKNPEENKETVSKIVSGFEKEIIRLNKLKAEKDKEEMEMIAAAKHLG